MSSGFIPTDVEEALEKIATSGRRMMLEYLDTASNGDWRRVTVNSDGSFQVHNLPQTRKKELAPAVVHPRTISHRTVEPDEPDEPALEFPQCPRPDKYIYPTREDAEERRLASWADDLTMNSYLCVCGFWHLGHRTTAALRSSVR